MKFGRPLFYLALSAILLFVLLLLLNHRWQTTKLANDRRRDKPLSEASKGGLPSENYSSNELAKSAMPFGKIISDTTTSSNRVVVAEKDGVQRTAIIPATLASALTDDQILYSLFHANDVPKQDGPGLNRRLVFYGLTVDDQTNVLAGTTVKGSVLVVDGQNQNQTVPVETVSDGAGRFQFDMDYGQLITLIASKSTNYISPPQRWFRYGSAGYGPPDSETMPNPNINNPVVFVLTKQSQPERLTEFRKNFYAPNNGEPVRVDFATGQVVSTGGDLIVSINCPEPYSELKSSPWSFSIKVVDGGLVQTGNSNTRMEYLLQAPSDGYFDGVDVNYDQNSTPYSRQYDGWFYVKSRSNAIYAKMYFSMNTRWDERGVPFQIWAIANTNASPNLQGVSQ